MKKLLLGAAFSLVIAANASAADLPPYTKEPVWSWTGCYLGGHAGGGTLRDEFTDKTGIGALGGGQVGCNYQVHRLVFGVEAEAWWAGFNPEANTSTPLGDVISQAKVRSGYDVAVRAGIAFDRALVYGKAGVVSARHDFSFFESFPFQGVGLIDTGSGTLTGLLIGLGLEYAVTSNWSTKLEYNYLGFGAKGINFTCADLIPGSCVANPPPVTNIGSQAQVIKVGINYKFW